MQDANLERVSKKQINHLLFMDDFKLYGNSEREAERLTNTVRIFSKDIDLEFRLCKCAHVTIKAGNLLVLVEWNFSLEKTRKIMTISRMYHPQSDTDRLHVRRMEGVGGLLSFLDCAETEEQNLCLYLDQSEGRLSRLS